VGRRFVRGADHGCRLRPGRSPAGSLRPVVPAVQQPDVTVARVARATRIRAGCR
jgi:hypothetical protein